MISILESELGLLQVLGLPRLHGKTLTQRGQEALWEKEVGIPYSQGYRVIMAGKTSLFSWNNLGDMCLKTWESELKAKDYTECLPEGRCHQRPALLWLV